MKSIEGRLEARGLKFGIIVSRFNDFINGRLLEGAVDALVRHGAREDDITVVRVPGAFEIPLVAGPVPISQWFLPPVHVDPQLFCIAESEGNGYKMPLSWFNDLFGGVDPHV